MAAIDILILVVLAVGTVHGFRKGIIDRLSWAAGIVAGLAACWILGARAVDLFCMLCPSHAQWPAPRLTASVAALAMLFALVYLSCRVAGLAVKSVSFKLKLGGLDRAAGAVAGLVMTVLVVGLVLDAALLLRPRAAVLDRALQRRDPVLVMTMMAAPLMLGADSVSLDLPAAPAPSVEKENMYSASRQGATS